MSKGLKALKVLVMSSTTIFNTKEQIDESIKIIEKELKALEIITKKVLVLPFLRLHLSLYDLKHYNKAMDKTHKLSQEEYDLLKEILADE